MLWTLARVLSDPITLSISLHNQPLQTPNDLNYTVQNPKSAELRLCTPACVVIIVVMQSPFTVKVHVAEGPLRR